MLWRERQVFASQRMRGVNRCDEQLVCCWSRWVSERCSYFVFSAVIQRHSLRSYLLCDSLTEKVVQHPRSHGAPTALYQDSAHFLRTAPLHSSLNMCIWLTKRNQTEGTGFSLCLKEVLTNVISFT